MAIPIKAFTVKSDTRQRVLVSKITVSTPFDPQKTPPPEKQIEFNGIWDTGATNCVISKKVVDALGLKPIAVREVCHGGGKEMCNVYLVSISLPHHVTFPQIPVTECKLTGSDVLIGMDIINTGDFAVTNVNGKTTFSFRMPSVETIDFVESAKKQQPIINQIPTAGRNDPCPCGSGKKYKKCHGK